jgi:hypothetical protein
LFATSVVDTAGINNNSEIGGKNLLPVSLIPVVNLELPISPLIFEKIRKGPTGMLRGL